MSIILRFHELLTTPLPLSVNVQVKMRMQFLLVFLTRDVCYFVHVADAASANDERVTCSNFFW